MTGRRGFTLLELMLVMALLVAIASLVLPMLRGPLETQRLRKSGELIRAVWANARLRAMQTGRIQIFRCQTGAGEYHVEPWFADTDATETSDTTFDSSERVAEYESMFARRNAPETLPDGIVFTDVETFADGRDQQVEEQVNQDPTTAAMPIAVRPVLFYPDGTTSTSRLVLGNRRPSYVLVQIRGLTGLTQASDVMSIDELSSLDRGTMIGAGD